MKIKKINLILNIFLLLSLLGGCDKKDTFSSATITGTVVNKNTSVPISNIRVQLGTEQFVATESNGSFTLRNIPIRESYTLVFHGNGYAKTEETREGSNMEELPFGEIQMDTTTNIGDLKTINIDGKKAFILPTDIGGKITQNQAISSCANLSIYGYNDWVLPNMSELNQMYIHKYSIGGFYEDWYMSSGNTNNSDKIQDFIEGTQAFSYRDEEDHPTYNARCRCLMYAPKPVSFGIDLNSDGKYDDFIFNDLSLYTDETGEKNEDDHYINFEKYSNLGNTEKRAVWIKNGTGDDITWELYNMPYYGLTVDTASGILESGETKVLIFTFTKPLRDDTHTYTNYRTVWKWDYYTSIGSSKAYCHQIISFVTDSEIIPFKVSYDALGN